MKKFDWCLIVLAALGWFLRMIILFILFTTVISCTDEETEKIPQQPESRVEGSWVKYSPYKWAHDGEPYFGEYCTVFSDGCSYSMKKEAGNLAENKFVDILQLFNFSDLEDLRYPTERKTIDVYINVSHPENIAAAYWGSIFITVRGSNIKTDIYEYLFKHELTHVFEFLIEGTVNLAGEMWFTEGIAIVGGGGINRIRTLEDLDSWISRNEKYPNKGNPIAIKKWEDYPAGSDKSGYYAVFEVVMKYMLDQEGLGHSIQDVLCLFYDLRYGINFNESFRKNFGIPVDLLEEEIFDRLRDYLADKDY